MAQKIDIKEIGSKVVELLPGDEVVVTISLTSKGFKKVRIIVDDISKKLPF